ncbi:MAG: GspH/FimT family pseudopilin [Woeseiaceae bacterium]
MRHTAENGFTIYELMITILIVGIVLALGLPNLGVFKKDNRISVTINDLQNTFRVARSEAVRAKANVTICASDNSQSPDAGCGGRWHNGYIAFVDIDGNLARDGADETLLKAIPAVADGVRLVVADDAKYFGITPAGTGRGQLGAHAAVSQIVVCDERGPVESSRGRSAAHLFVATPLGLATTTHEYVAVSGALQQMNKSCDQGRD